MNHLGGRHPYNARVEAVTRAVPGIERPGYGAPTALSEPPMLIDADQFVESLDQEAELLADPRKLLTCLLSTMVRETPRSGTMRPLPRHWALSALRCYSRGGARQPNRRELRRILDALGGRQA